MVLSMVKKLEKYNTMNPETFQDKLHAAAVCHNMGVINRRTGKTYDAIQSFEDSLDIYNECVVHYNNISKSIKDAKAKDPQHIYQTPNKSFNQSVPICLELKIAQTLQSMARSYIKSLNDTDSAIKAHEDAINFLVHRKFILDDVEEAEDSCCKQKKNSYMMYDSPQRQERISRHYNLCDENDNSTSPTTVMGEGRETDNNQDGNRFNFVDIDEYNVVFLTQHERMRVITSSLNALARIYTTLETEDYERKQSKLHRTVVNEESDSEEVDQEEEEEEEGKLIEDPLQYYQQALSYLGQVHDLSSETLIPALSNESKTIATASDAALTINKHSPPMLIDLRKDIGSTLMEMGALHMQREHYTLAVDVFEKARDIRYDLCYGNEMDDEYIESLYSLSLSYQKSGFFDKALQNFKSVMKTKKQKCGQESIEVANLYCNMSNILRQTGNVAESLSYIKRAIVVYKRNKECYEEHGIESLQGERGSNHHITVCKCILGALKNCAALYIQMEEGPMAIEIYQQVLEIQKQLGMEDHPDFAATMNILGDLYYTNDELGKAKSAFGFALAMYREFGLGENDPDFIMTMKCIEEIDAILNSRQISNLVENHPPAITNNVAMENNNSLQERSKSCKSISQKQRHRSRQNNDSFDELPVTGFEISASSDDDDLVSNITFSTKKKASDYVYEGVLSVSKAMENVATVAEDFLSGSLGNHKNKRQPSRSKIPSKREFIDENIEQVLGRDEDSSIIHNNDQDRADDLSTLFGSYVTETSFKSIEKPGNHVKNIGYEVIGTSLSSGAAHAECLKILAPSDASSCLDDGSTLIGTSFLNNESVKNAKSIPSTPNESNSRISQAKKDTNTFAVNKSYSSNNIDDLLAQMNVVTNDMVDEGNAKPFQDVLQIEPSDFDSSPDFSVVRRKNFEKLSSCLDKLEELEEKYGSEHIKCLETLQTLADIYIDNGDKLKGINTLVKVTVVQKKKYGDNHLEVADTYLVIAKLCIELKEYSRAIDNYSRVKEIEEYLYGNTDTRIALTLNKIGELELRRGDFDLAMDKFQEALRILRLYLAPNETNPELSQTLVNIGSVYYKERNSYNKIKQGSHTYESFIESGMLGKIAFAHSERGEYVKATHFYEELLQLLKNRSQSNNGMVSTLNHLGYLSVKLSRYVEAMSYHQQALEILESAGDANDLEICKGKINVGVVEYKSGNFSRAIEIIEREINKMKSLMDNDHCRAIIITVAKADFHLGVIRRILCQYEKALDHLNSAYSVQLGLLQKHHPDIMSTQLEIGIVKLDLYELDAALEIFNSLLQNQLVVMVQDHPDVALTHHYAGTCYVRKGEVRMASKCLWRSHEICLKLHGGTSEGTRLLETLEFAKLLEEIGFIHLSKEKYNKAAIVFQESFRIRRECFGQDHYEIAYGMLSLGILFTEQAELQKAISLLQKAMKIALKTFGPQHPLVADIHLNIGKVYQRKCHFDEAKKEISSAVKIYKLSLSSSHEKFLSAIKSLERVDREEELCV